MTTFRRYAIALAATCLLFIVLNFLNFYRSVTCWDCFFPYGLPFTLYQKGGEAGGAGIVWRGLAADGACVIALALVVGRVWQGLATRSN